ncbi:hypothetical protein B0H13DRAFT_1880374 [Mycena leptocephala]|nr:hypothetical protein B0H13DRAFT_1880374 [Mycena leptocephala]
MLFGTSDNYNTEYTERLYIDLAKDAYRSTNRKDEFSQMTLWLEPSELSAAQIERQANSFDVSFNAVPVFQRIKFSTSDPYANDGPVDSIVGSIHVQPRKLLKNGDEAPARFDTALVNTGHGGKAGTAGYRIAQVSRVIKNGDRLASIIPVYNIQRSIHLLPKFGPVAPQEWKSHNVLDKFRVFFANPWTDRRIYATLY